MEGLNLDNILDPEQINDLFNGTQEGTPPPAEPTGEEEEQPKNENNNNETDEITDVPINELFGNAQESVGNESNEETKEKENTPPTEKKGNSSNFYSSIAKALKDEGVFPDLDDDSVNGSDSAEKFTELIKKQIEAGLTDTQKRINEALNYDVEPDTINKYERLLNGLDSITMENLKAEDENGENLRKSLIYQDYISRGYSEERARKEVEKSLKAGSDIDDAIESLKSVKETTKSQYESLINKAKEEKNKIIEKQKEEAESFKKSIFEDKTFWGDVEVDKATRQKIFDNMCSPKYKQEDGTMLTEIQNYQRNNPLEFHKNLGLLYTLTDGFKNIDKLVQGKVKKEVSKSMKNLESILNTTSRNSDGSFKMVTSSNDQEANFNSKDWDFDV